MRKIKSLLLITVAVALSLVFSACSKKQIVFKTKYLCEQQEIYPKPAAEFRVKKDDVGVAKAFIKANNYTYNSYKQQVQAHNIACKELKNKTKGKNNDN